MDTKKSLFGYSILLLVVLSLLAFKTSTQDGRLLKKIIGKLLVYNKTSGPEKTYVQTDKDFYTNGETIWFKTYLIDGITHTQSNKSKVVYVELVDSNGGILAHRKIYTDAYGASGDIHLGKNIRQGIYQLRSYTKYMLNDEEPVIFQKDIPIVVQKIKPSANLESFTGTSQRNTEPTKSENSEAKFGKPNVRFFPEGGSLVEGISTVLGIEITDDKNNGIALKGVIKDNKGKTVVPFESLEFGLGKVNFKPFPNKSYYASIEIDGLEQKFELPEINPQGYGLSIKNQSDHMFVQVVGNTEKGVSGTILIAHLRGKLIFKRVGKWEDDEAYAVKLFNKELLDGVAQFTLFAPNGEPVCERLVFVDNPSNDIGISITSNGKSHGLREKVSLDVALTNTDGIPLRGDFSMGVVTSNNRLENKSNSSDIRSWLLLDSDLGGSVPDAGYFFEDNSKERYFLLDALMLTHGWRRFIWTDLLNKETNKALPYPPEKGIMITGRTTAFDNQFSPKKTTTFLNTFGESLFNEQQSTNIQGQFSFGPFIFTDSVTGVIHAVDPIERKAFKRKDISIFLDSQQPHIALKGSTQRKTNRRTTIYNNEYLKQSYRSKVADFNFGLREITQLDEVVVAEKKKTRNDIITEEMNAELTSSMFSERIFTDSIPGSESDSAFDLLRRVAGVFVKGIYPQQEVEIRGEKTTLFLLDGIVTPIDRVQEMRANELMFVDILKGSAASVFGSRGAGGVIAFYTDRGLRFDDKKRPPAPGITDFKVPGFHKTREFYRPNYGNPKKEHEKPDYSTTLLWEPNIRMTKEGSSSVDFYTGDSAGSYTIRVEGITEDGRPISGSSTIQVDESN